MNYFKILHIAKSLTAKNPIFWLFGLVLYGGFNLYFLNFFALFSKTEWHTWPITVQNIFGNAIYSYVLLIVTGIILFVLWNLIKIIFIVLVHNEIHKVLELECDLCVKVKAEQLNYWVWMKSVLLASVVTIVLSTSIVFAISSVVYGFGKESVPAVIINGLIIVVVTSVIGAWNLFTSFFVVMHGMWFSRASKAALDLLTLRFRAVIEFGFIISAIYFMAAYIANAFIYTWHHGIGGETGSILRGAALIIFVLWFAFNNVFFNIALIVFFNKLVKSISARKEVVDGQLQPNILH